MSDLEKNLEELERVKQSFKSKITNTGISTTNVEFRNMPELINQMEKKLPSQDKTVTPTKEVQSVVPDAGYRLQQVDVNPIPDEYIIPSGTLSITENGTHAVKEYENVDVNVAGGELAGYNVESIVSEDGASQTLKITSGFSANGNPIEVSTDEEMTNALTEANLGKVYKFTGTSSTYETDAIYIISEV